MFKAFYIQLQMDVMRKDLENRLKNFSQEVEKFTARWNQLKPSDIEADSSPEKFKAAAENIKDRKLELDEIIKNREKLL